MALSVEQIQTAQDDEALFSLLSEELQRIFPEEVRRDEPTFKKALDAAPKGLRAMAGIHSLDVSITMDDLAWHFGNHQDDFDLQETQNGLRVLEADEAARLFQQAWEIMKPYMNDLRDEKYGKDFTEWLKQTGIQAAVGPLSERMRVLADASEDYGLMHYWLTFARKYPERCAQATEANLD